MIILRIFDFPDFFWFHIIYVRYINYIRPIENSKSKSVHNLFQKSVQMSVLRIFRSPNSSIVRFLGWRESWALNRYTRMYGTGVVPVRWSRDDLVLKLKTGPIRRKTNHPEKKSSVILDLVGKYSGSVVALDGVVDSRSEEVCWNYAND